MLIQRSDAYKTMLEILSTNGDGDDVSVFFYDIEYIYFIMYVHVRYRVHYII